jgi:inorganic triphosphatase YgiF
LTRVKAGANIGILRPKRFSSMNEPLNCGVDAEGSGTGREVEVKFRTDPAGLKQVLNSRFFAAPAAVRSESLRTIYFDTSPGDLRKREIALRIRRRGRGGPVLGVKSKRGTAEGPFSRTEIEVRAHGLQPNLALFGPQTAAELGLLVGERPLEAQFETKIRRRSVLVARGHSEIELACDDGCLVAGDRQCRLAELELELKAGEESDLCDLATVLIDELPLRLDFASKAERGFRLATGENAPVVKAAPIDYGADATLDDAVVAIISNTLAQFVGNWDALRTTEQPEAVHQARVALRRLRSALRMFQRALPCPQFEALRIEAGRIASAFGPTRERDVFLQSVIDGPLGHGDPPLGFESLLTSVREGRATGCRDIRDLIQDVATTRFVLDLRSLVARRGWRNALAGPELARLSGPAEVFARPALERLHSRASKRGKKLAELADEARHELRIVLKNLRYGAEFFGALFGGRGKVRRYQETVSVLQDVLGVHNDVVSARRLLDGSPPETERVSGFILGWLARESSLADDRLFAAWKKFKETDVFWRQ